MQSKKTKIFKVIILAVFLLIMAWLTVTLVPMFKNISTEEGRVEFKQKIESMGGQGCLVIIGLMIIQIFLPILPGEPVEVLAGMCFGTFGGLMIVFLGAFISSCIIFFGVRKFGRNFIYSFVKKDKLEKLEKSEWFSNPKKIYSILFILFFIPGAPKDLLIYLGGLLPIKPMKFILISTFARFPSIISSTIAGSSLVNGNWWLIILTYALTLLFAVMVAWLVKRNH